MDLHPSLTWRPLETSDADDLQRLFNAVEEADAQPFRMSLDEVVEDLGETWRDLAHESIVGIDEDGVARAWMLLTAPPEDATERRVYLDGGVDPELRGRGIGRTVASWGIDRAHELLARRGSGDGVPWRVGVVVGTESTGTTHLYERLGFGALRHYANLRRDLDAPLVDAPAADGIVLSQWGPQDEEEVRLAHNAAFADHWGSQPSSPERWLTGRSTFAAGWSLVARDTAREGSPVVGYLRSDRFPDDWPAQGFTSGYVHLLGVVREGRGRGIASLLLTRALELFREDGMEAGTLGVDTANPTGAYRLYERLGFRVYHSEVLLGVSGT
ncbi:GNAT family N-acetyltransferase [Sanguibacter sp. HDW7]|uniref:GNAT family N-acetyltransferase n=1 Tax=Sanguibacter sp. HDW7 TaxID=2714931 RepID=UPI00140CE6C0|nr:GNAT family N-acetyltransferase [Sanguibacter sp. HDW7]QIK83689.1 GNAT family N-acetyltransferase [Sanguibacter sp. HDW7]